jgi:hypothetical protein
MLVQDVRLGLRMMRRRPGFTAVVLLVLALGVGANAVIFSVVNTLLLRPLLYPRAAELQLVQTVNDDGGAAATAPPDFYEYRARNRSLRSLASFYSRPYDLTGVEEPERIRALVVASGFLGTLGTPPAIGRDLAPTKTANPRSVMAEHTERHYSSWVSSSSWRPGTPPVGKCAIQSLSWRMVRRTSPSMICMWSMARLSTSRASRRSRNSVISRRLSQSERAYHEPSCRPQDLGGAIARGRKAGAGLACHLLRSPSRTQVRGPTGPGAGSCPGRRAVPP